MAIVSVPEYRYYEKTIDYCVIYMHSTFTRHILNEDKFGR